MKALTIRQPWAWAVARGYKTVENRSAGAAHWPPTANLLIHSSQTWSERGAADERIKRAWVQGATDGVVGDLTFTMDEWDPLLGMGLVLAVVDLVDVHPDASCHRPWGESSYMRADGTVTRNVTHLLFDAVRPLTEPLPYRRGRLGLWSAPDELAAAALERARSAS